jgi:group I intron endonuclease
MSKLSAEEKFFQTFYIYKITNKINGKIYIGYSSKPKQRWNNHTRIAREGPSKRKGQFYAIHAAIFKYGIENFEMKIIDRAFDAYKICVFEKYWISYYQSNKIGYNLTPGGECLIGADNPFYGKNHTEETKKLLSEQRQAEGRGRGEKNPKAKITENQAKEIKYSKLSTKKLALQFNVDRTIIQRIRSGKIWKHI